jgi:hypothetical protein
MGVGEDFLYVPFVYEGHVGARCVVASGVDGSSVSAHLTTSIDPRHQQRRQPSSLCSVSRLRPATGCRQACLCSAVSAVAGYRVGVQGSTTAPPQPALQPA